MHDIDRRRPTAGLYLMVLTVPGGCQRPAIRVYRRDKSIWLLVLSLTLHLAVLVGLLLNPLASPAPGVSDPMPVEFIMEKGPADAALEAVSPAKVPASQPAETPLAPAPAPEMAPPLIQQTEAQPPMATSVPDLVSTVQQAEIPLSVPALAQTLAPPIPALQSSEAVLPTPPVPPPQPVTSTHPPPSPPVLQTRPRRLPPPRTVARPAVTSAQASQADAPTRAAEGRDAPGRVSAGNNGAAWMGRLKQWWDQNSFYPREASQTDEGGNVRVHILISGDGRVTSIDVVQSSGSGILDSAAMAVFRNARLPPLPPGTPPQPADVVVTLHYRPSNSGR